MKTIRHLLIQKTTVRLYGMALMCTFVFITHNSEAQLGNAIELDGSASYVEIPFAVSDSIFPLTDNFTIEAWVKPCGLTGMIVSKQWCQDGQSGFYLSLDAGKLKWVFDPDGSCNTAPNVYMSNNVIATTDTWVHVAVVHRSTGVQLYVNGSAVAATLTGSNSAIHAVNRPLRIGVYEALAGTYAFLLHGLVDEVRIWKTTRSAAQILSTMNTPLAGTETNLLAYYNMDGITGSGQNVVVPNHSIMFGAALNGTTKGTATLPDFIDRSISACLVHRFGAPSDIENIGSGAPSYTGVSVVPNPVLNSATLMFDQQSGQHVLEIINQQGAMVSRQVFSDGSKVSFDKKELPSGVYVFVLTNSDKDIRYKGKCIVE